MPGRPRPLEQQPCAAVRGSGHDEMAPSWREPSESAVNSRTVTDLRSSPPCAGHTGPRPAVRPQDGSWPNRLKAHRGGAQGSAVWTLALVSGNPECAHVGKCWDRVALARSY